MRTERLDVVGGPAQLVTEFVNTGGETPDLPERFGQIGDFAQWATRRGLLGDVDESGIYASDLAAARELRYALRTVLLHHADPDAIAADRLREVWDYLARVAVRYPLTAVITGEGVRLVAQGTGVPRLLGTVFAATVESERAGSWSRVKACSSPPCEKAFIDQTRNHSTRYCTPGCASRASMRLTRRRQQSSAG